MPVIGRTAKTQSQNLRLYKLIAVAAGVDRCKIGNWIAQPTSTPSATGRLLLMAEAQGLAVSLALR